LINQADIKSAEGVAPRIRTQVPQQLGDPARIFPVGLDRHGRECRFYVPCPDRYQVGTVLCVQDKEMKQAWCLATSSTSATSKALMSLYGKRWGIECGLRDT
jgi:hypothetical protein